jgi:UDP-3-O-[3-hydroxymyristoyl] glucosamine N-acyltransferase
VDTPRSPVTLDELAGRFGGEVTGDGSVLVNAIGTLERAEKGQLSFLTNSKYRRQLAASNASAVNVGEADRDATTLPRIVAANPYLYFARVAAFFCPPPPIVPGVHPSAVVEASSAISPTSCVGALAYVGKDVVIGERCMIGNHVSIADGVILGDDCRLFPRVVIYADCHIGNRVILHSGVVIGADGFGLAPDQGQWVKIPQVGRVIIGDDVEIGANTTVDRGALDDTVVEEGVKLDNQIQVGHNVQIGAYTAIAGCVGIAGSAKIGKRCTIGGGAGISGHLELCDDVHVSAFTMISKSITKPGRYTSQLPQMTHEEWRNSAPYIRRLDDLAEKLKALQKRIEKG